ncbi:MAG: BREX system Lon protease-like protein BrxL [Christensenellaceae bacterium]
MEEKQVMEEKLRKYFGEMCVKKNAALEQAIGMNVPSYIRDWGIRCVADRDGNYDPAVLAQELARRVPRKETFLPLLDRIMLGEDVRFACRILVGRNVASGEVTFSLPDLGVTDDQTRIDPNVWKQVREELLSSEAVWGVVSLGYAREGKKGKIFLKEFRPFAPYKVDLAYYKKAREFFTLSEWIDLLLGAVDYAAEGFETEEQKLALLTRLLPFVEKRLNLIELAPKGTGKSYLFSRISKRVWLVSGGVVTRAKLFYDMGAKRTGLMTQYDAVALDEISTIRFRDADELLGALKCYLENGTFTVGTKESRAEAGLVLLGNAPKGDATSVLSALPAFFADSALLDRFHGYLDGWRIPRMSEDKKQTGWALNTEYFAQIAHLLREENRKRTLTDSLIEVSKGADTRDVTAVKRIATAYVKLLFPHWDEEGDVDKDLFERYCLAPAVRMRSAIVEQIASIDIDLADRKMPTFTVAGT